MKNINLVEILRDCPDGTKLYSTLHGEVVFKYITEDHMFPILVDYSDVDGNTSKTCFTKDGKFLYSANGECVLFPSEEQRDWSKFTAPWYKKDKSVEPKFKAGDMVRHKDTNKDDVYEISKVYDDSYGIAGFNWMILMKYQDQYELVSNKFDPKTLKPFDKVLARRGNENYNVWFPDFISDPPNSTNNKTLCMCVMEDIAMVIPYNDETKHLVGTTEEAPEYYRYWE